MRGTRTTVTLGAALLVAALAAAAVAAGSPAAPRHGEAGWRNAGTGRFPRAAPPLTWSPTANVIWKRRMGNWSNATPVLHRGRIFTLEETATVVCLDAARGEDRICLDMNTVTP